MQDAALQLADMLRGAKRAFALTGAGMSTESGLPDYRGASGLWKNRRFEQLANIEMFRQEPVEFWEFYRMRLAALRQAHPNSGHFALAEIERAGHLDIVATQNVDGLHARAGSTTIEMHGSLARSVCLECGYEADMDEVEVLSDAAGDGVPRCPNCSFPLKPGVVLFGEQLPPEAERAFELAAECDLLLVCGTSLAVYPVAFLPNVVHGNGGKVAIVNIGESEYGSEADLVVDAPVGEFLPHVAAALA